MGGVPLTAAEVSPRPRLQQNQRLAPERGNYDTPGIEGKEAAVSRMRCSANGVERCTDNPGPPRSGTVPGLERITEPVLGPRSADPRVLRCARDTKVPYLPSGTRTPPQASRTCW